MDEEEEPHQGIKHEKLFRSELFSNPNNKFSIYAKQTLGTLNLDKEYYYDPFLAVLVPPPKQHS